MKARRRRNEQAWRVTRHGGDKGQTTFKPLARRTNAARGVCAALYLPIATKRLCALDVRRWMLIGTAGRPPWRKDAPHIGCLRKGGDLRPTTPPPPCVSGAGPHL